jgi:hypothetical protein
MLVISKVMECLLELEDLNLWAGLDLREATVFAVNKVAAVSDESVDGWIRSVKVGDGK